MRAFKGRRLNIAFMLALFVPTSFLGIQTLAFAARNATIGGAKAHNPTCGQRLEKESVSRLRHPA
jgi:hypothetical protein